MAIVKINPIKIEGRWNSGVALDLHTTSSTPIGYNEFGYMQFDTVRPEIAELKWFTEFGHLNRGDMLTSEQHRCHNEKKKFQRRV
ncbi:hypothetical protein [Escherichia coli]|uniref:hypothetical protein n=1 Tax=Escherichia coli TaxID=562 RepID=UPI001877D187|nr:hypothetical protein [Escherichia coli]